MKSTHFFSLLGFIALLAATGCERKAEPTKETPMPVDITTLETAVWQLTKILADPLPFIVPDTIPISIKFAEGKLEGHDGCNGIGGSYVADGKNLTISNLIQTQMYCEGASQWEERFVQCLENAQTYKIDGEELEILSGDMGGLVFRLNWKKR